MSAKLTPAAATSTRSCPGPGAGASRCTTVRTSAPPCLSAITARMSGILMRVGALARHPPVGHDGQLLLQHGTHALQLPSDLRKLLLTADVLEHSHHVPIDPVALRITAGVRAAAHAAASVRSGRGPRVCGWSGGTPVRRLLVPRLGRRRLGVPLLVVAGLALSLLGVAG